MGDLPSEIQELIDIFSIGANEKGIEVIFNCSELFPSEIYTDA